MTTITEDYVSFEIAKLLKENGFSCSSYSHYRLNDGELCSFNTNCNTNLKQNDYITAPTLQMAMKWLREVHNLYIEPYVIKNYNNKKLEYTYSIQDLDFNGSDDGIECCKNWNSPEEACEAAIKYCLENLI